MRSKKRHPPRGEGADDVGRLPWISAKAQCPQKPVFWFYCAPGTPELMVTLCAVTVPVTVWTGGPDTSRPLVLSHR